MSVHETAKYYLNICLYTINNNLLYGRIYKKGKGIKLHIFICISMYIFCKPSFQLSDTKLYACSYNISFIYI